MEKATQKQIFVRAPQMADLIGVSHITLVKWARMGKIPGVNPHGRLWLFEPDRVVFALRAMEHYRPDKDGRGSPKGEHHAI